MDEEDETPLFRQIFFSGYTKLTQKLFLGIDLHSEHIFFSYVVLVDEGMLVAADGDCLKVGASLNPCR